MSNDNSIFLRPPREQRRVVVTGLATVNPLGINVQESWENIKKGQSGIDKISLFDASQIDSQIAGEVKDFNTDAYVPKKEQKKMDRFIHFSLACAKMAIEDSGIEFDDNLRQRTGVIIGVGIGGLPVIEKQHSICEKRGPGRISPFFIPAVLTNLAAGQVSIEHKLEGPNYSLTSACASGSHSIGEATQYIRSGLCDVMLAGGAEATVCPMAVGGFSSMKALSTRNNQPKEASRPWDKDRDGFVLSEGAGLVVLEDYERASKRGARIYGEVTGYGMSSDAHHMTNPSPGGAGAALAMHIALKDAQLNCENIDYVNAHGTSTPVGDEIEAQAIKSIFKDAAKKLWVSSTKSMTGHTLGAAGAIESVFSLLTLQNNVAPPTINLENPGEGCDLDFIPGTAREKKMTHVMNNSFGFGGTNACLIFSRMD